MNREFKTAVSAILILDKKKKKRKRREGNNLGNFGVYTWTNMILKKTHEWNHVEFTFSRLSVNMACGLTLKCRQHN